MTEEPEPTLEQVTAEIITSGRIRREEVCTRLGIGDDMLEVCYGQLFNLRNPIHRERFFFQKTRLTD